MGQAKKRGTFEERVEQSKAATVARREALLEHRRQVEAELQERIEAMSEEERAVFVARNRKRKGFLSTFLAITGALAVPGGPRL